MRLSRGLLGVPVERPIKELSFDLLQLLGSLSTTSVPANMHY